MQKILQKKNIFFGLVGLLVASYLFLSLQAPVNPEAQPEFVLTGITKLVVQLSFIIPFSLAWIFGSITVWRGWSLSVDLKDVSTRKVFQYISLGLGILLAGFIAGTLIGQIRTFNPTDKGIAKAVTIGVNYIYVLAQLFGFWSLYRGAAAGHKQKFLGLYNRNIIVGTIFTLAIGLFWVGLIYSNPTRQISTGPGINPSFYIDDLLIFSTIILPTIFAWFFGIMASLGLADIAVTTQDTSLQKAFAQLVSGTWLLISAFIVLLGILSAGGERLLGLGLAGVLVIIYVFVLLILLAYWRTASAMKGVNKNIELHAHEPR